MVSESQATIMTESESIQHQLDETRSGLVEKLENLETQVLGMVQNASDTVADTIDNVKQSVGHTVDAVHDAVQNTVTSAKHAVDIRRHVREYPLAMVGGAVLLGFALGIYISPA